MRRFRLLAAVLVVLAVGSVAQATILDISSGFNADVWCGPKEMQAIYNYAAANETNIDLQEAQGSTGLNPAWYVVDQQRLLVGASATEQYATPNEWFYDGHQAFVDETEGTPEDGVLTGADRQYHIASVGGNATLPGNWLEVANPVAYGNYNADPDNVQPMATKNNAMVIGCLHSIASLQIVEMTATLPLGQQGQYSDINFVIAARNASQRARYMNIVALYTDGSEEVIYAFSNDAAVGPVILDSIGDNTGEFAVIESMTQVANTSSGTTGNIGATANSLYEFITPLALNSSKTLAGIKIIDTNPTQNYQARGLTVFAATATEVPEPASMGLVLIGGLAMLRRR